MINIKKCTIQSLGPIKQGELELGDLTLLVGPQATGKSIFLQTFKLLLDRGNIIQTLDRYGFSWQKNLNNFLALYFGEGMENLWQDNSRITINGRKVELAPKRIELAPKRQKPIPIVKVMEQVFFIPAQRVISLSNGWFRPISEYDSSVPYVLKIFSEQLRMFIDYQFREEQLIFPGPKHLGNVLNEILNQRIFNQATIKIDNSKLLRKRIILQLGKEQLPFMVWSTGQREFFPLWLSIYWLLEKRNNRRWPWVLIEEPEMGLHPKAMVAVMLVVFKLLKEGKRVIISTHSPQILDVVWAIREMQKIQAAPSHLAKIFELSRFKATDRRRILDLCQTMLAKTVRTYYFSKEENGVYIRDISTLDPGDPQIDIAGWGGLTEFSSHVGYAVADAVQSQM
jgi:energy-coupling factor transporter ATP-binding protein EcfA2